MTPVLQRTKTLPTARKTPAGYSRNNTQLSRGIKSSVVVLLLGLISTSTLAQETTQNKVVGQATDETEQSVILDTFVRNPELSEGTTVVDDSHSDISQFFEREIRKQKLQATQEKDQQSNQETTSEVNLQATVAQMEPQKMFKSSPVLRSVNEGVSDAGPPSYYSLSGFSGFRLPLSLPAEQVFDYTVMFWFRAHQTLDEMRYNKKDAYLFEIPGGMACFIKAGAALACSPEQTEGEHAGHAFEIPLSHFPDIQSWMHVTLTAYEKRRTQPAYSILRIDFPGNHIQVQGGYAPILTDSIFLGIDVGMKGGFDGDVRELFVSLGTLDDPSHAPLLANQKKVWDVSIMGYYRFEQKNDLSDYFRYQQGYAKVSPQVDRQSYLPVWKIENASNPLCETLDSFATVPSFDKSWQPIPVPVPMHTVPENNFGYTLSMWVKNYGHHTFSRNPQEGRNFHHFFELEEAFALWFDSPYSFRMYIYAWKNYKEQFTESVFLPLNQWANIQVTLDQHSGVTIMVFNDNGERQQVLQHDFFLSEMRPTGKMIPFQNFFGLVHSIAVWEKFIQTPVPNYEDTDRLIIGYDFQLDNYDAGWASFAPGGQTLEAFEQIVHFHTVKVPSADLNYNTPSKIGQLHALETHWDGVACPQKDKSLVKLTGKGAALSLQQTFKLTDAFTVELWFRFNSDSQVNEQDVTYLFTMAKGESEAMTIYIDTDGILKCAPFGRNTIDPDTILTYHDVLPLATTEWQHVSCVYKQSKFIRGEYLKLNITQSEDSDFSSQKAENQLKAKSVSKSLVNRKERNLNYVSDQTWDIVVGNNHNSSLIQDAFFKDVRVWTEERSVFDLYTYRFKQAPLSDSLVTNLKLMDGSPIIWNYDFARQGTPEYRTFVLSQGMELVDRDSSNVICGSESYYVPNAGMCTSFPFQKNIPIWYYTINNVLHGHQAIITSKFAKSALLLPGYQPHLSYYWRSRDQPVDELFVKERREVSELELDPIYLGDNTNYMFGLSIHDSVHHQFYQAVQQDIIPRKCLHLADSSTLEAVNEKVLIKGSETDQDDEGKLCFNFEVMRVDGCEDNFYNNLQGNIKIETQPPMSPSFLNQATLAFNSNRKVYEVCYSKEALASEEMLMNRDINFIFTVYWKSSQSESTAYMHIIYKVLYVDDILPVLAVSSDLLDVEETLIMSAAGSRDVITESKEGLFFRWNCPDIFQSWCNQFEGVSTLEIPPEAFRSYGGQIDEEYEFEILVSNIQSGPNPDHDQQTFKKSQKVKWMSLAPPAFEISMLSSTVSKDGVEHVLTSAENVARIQLSNYRITDPQLTIEWIVDPQIPELQLSADNSAMIFPAGVLKQDQSYSIEVKIENTQLASSLAKKVLNFKTGKPPNSGTVNVNPTSGIMFEDDFEISLSGWVTDNPPLQYELFGVTNKESNSRIKLSTSKKTLDDTGSASESRKLPLLVGIQADISDSFGESITYDVDVNVTRRNDGTDWKTIITNFVREQKNPVTKYQYLSFMANQLNEDALKDNQKSEIASSSNEVIVNEVRQDLVRISSTDSSNKAQVNLLAMTNAVAQATTNPNTLMPEVAITAGQCVESIYTKKAAFDRVVADASFQKAYALSIANLIDFGATRANLEAEQIETTANQQVRESDSEETLEETEEDEAERLLQSLGTAEAMEEGNEYLRAYRAMIHRQMVQKNKLLDSICGTLDSIGQEKRVSTTKMDLLVHKIAVDKPEENADLQYVDLDDGTTVIVPTDELVKQSTDLNSDIEFVCIQTTFLTINPLAGYTFNQQVIGKDQFVQTSTLDSHGNRIVSDQNGLSNLELAPFLIHFEYNFEAMDFYKNQTVCMAFNGNLQVYEGERWSTDTCTTTYNRDGKEVAAIDGNTKIEKATSIVCRCESMKNHYYAVVTDFSRDLEYEFFFSYQFNLTILFVLIPYIIFGLFLPCCLARMDKTDYTRVTEDKFDITDALIEYLVQRTGEPTIDEFYFKLAEIERYMKLDNFGPLSRGAVKTFHRNEHPLFSLTSKFDYRMKRFTRLVFVISQLNLVTLIAMLVFSGQRMSTDYSQSAQVLIVSAVIGIFTLPWPNMITDLISTSLEKNSGQSGQTKNSDNISKNSQVDIEKSSQNSERVLHNFRDNCMTLKLIFYVFTYLVWLVMIILLCFFLALGLQARTDYPMLSMTNDEAACFVATWWIGVVFFGWLLYNEIRIFIIASMAPKEGEILVKKKEKPSRTCVSYCLIPYESVKTAHLVLLIKKWVKKNGNQQSTDTANTPIGPVSDRQDKQKDYDLEFQNDNLQPQDPNKEIPEYDTHQQPQNQDLRDAQPEEMEQVNNFGIGTEQDMDAPLTSARNHQSHDELHEQPSAIANHGALNMGLKKTRTKSQIHERYQEEGIDPNQIPIEVKDHEASVASGDPLKDKKDKKDKKEKKHKNKDKDKKKHKKKLKKDKHHD